MRWGNHWSSDRGKGRRGLLKPNRCVKRIQVPPGPELVPRDEICWGGGELNHLVEEFESHSDLQGKTQL